MALGREHVRCLGLPNAQHLEPQVLARRPARPAARPARRALNVLCAARFLQTRLTAAATVGIVSCEVRAHYALAARVGRLLPVEFYNMFTVCRLRAHRS